MDFYHMTYQDPRKIPEHPSWPLGKSLVHFATTSDLITGLKACIGDSLHSEILPIESLVCHPKLYGQWASFQNGIDGQFSLLSTLLEECFAHSNPELFQQLRLQQGELLESIRLCLALDLTLNPGKWTEEQQALAILLTKIQQENYLPFALPHPPTLEGIKEVLGLLFGVQYEEIPGLVLYGVPHWDGLTLRCLWELRQLGLDLYVVTPDFQDVPGLRTLQEGGQLQALVNFYQDKPKPTLHAYDNPWTWKGQRGETPIYLPDPHSICQGDTLVDHPLGTFLVGCHDYHKGTITRAEFLAMCITSPVVDGADRVQWLTLYDLALPILQSQVDPMAWFQGVYQTASQLEGLERLSIYSPKLAQLPKLLGQLSQWEDLAHTIMEEPTLAQRVEQWMAYGYWGGQQWAKEIERRLLEHLASVITPIPVAQALLSQVNQYGNTWENPVEIHPLEGVLGQCYQGLAHGQPQVCHIGGLSQRGLTPTVTQQLPWPLTEALFQSACQVGGEMAALYDTYLKEKGRWLTQVLDYVLDCQGLQVELSYMRHQDGQPQRPYMPFALLDFPLSTGEDWGNQEPPTALIIPQEKTPGIAYRRHGFMSMLLCPYRFFLEEGLEDGTCIYDLDQYQQYFENLLIQGVWEILSGMPEVSARERLPRALDQVSKGYQPYFPFWNQDSIAQREAGAKSYIFQSLMQGRGKPMRDFAPSHMEMRKAFGAASFDGTATKHPYSAFEQLIGRRRGSGWYSLHHLPKLSRFQRETPQIKGLQEEVKQYLNQSQAIDHQAIPGDWCKWCNHKNHCSNHLEWEEN